MRPQRTSWATYLRVGIGRRLSLIGERYGIDKLVYNPLVFYEYHESAIESAWGVVEALREVFPKAKRVADIGSGSCAFAAEFARRGYGVEACEKSFAGRIWGKKQGVTCKPFNLEIWPPADLLGPFDFAYCFEVAEHLNEELGQKLVKYLCSIASIIVFTAGQPGQIGIGHIFLKEKKYWIMQFDQFGFRFNAEMAKIVAELFAKYGVKTQWLINNCMIFIGKR